MLCCEPHPSDCARICALAKGHAGEHWADGAHLRDMQGLVRAATALGVELTAKLEKAEDALTATRSTLAGHVEENLTLHARCSELEAKLTATERSHDATDALLKVEEERRRAAEARIAAALKILSEPGMWSDFAARAKKALGDG